ncbi:MAG: helix-hairpin-helix domain-containing protein [Rikenellaceae bacterium]
MTGLNAKEIRGAVVLLILLTVLLLVKYIYNRIDSRRVSENAIAIASQIDDFSGLHICEFDPNTVELRELMSFGLSRQEAVSIIRYRSYGKVFRIKEDLFTCYGVSDSLYYALEPYIVIADTFQYKNRYEDRPTSSKPTYNSSKRYERKLLTPSPFLVDTVGVNYLMAIGALSRRQAEVFVRWRNLSGIYNMDELRECYVISDSIAYALEPYAIFTPPAAEVIELVDLNKADSATLRSVYGIGEKSVVQILSYRQKLGGFYSVDQLSELKVITESNFEKIIKQISCDSCDISKIDVNFASAKTMKGHPYITDKVLRRLLKIRELKGGWSTIEEMTQDEIFTGNEAARVRPYLLFGEFEPREVSGDEFF